MSQTSYAGLDYSLGQSNVNRKTGIHYGVISQHSVNLDCWSDAEADYGNPHCPECGNEAKTIPTHTESSNPPGQWVSVIVDMPEEYEDYEGSGDYACEDCKHLWDSSEVFGDEPLGYSLDDGEYKLTDCLDFDIFVLKSPYYTFAQFCSPCVPGAGNLDSPCDNGPKTYCLGHGWFDEGIAPYTVYRVADDSVVEP